MFSLLVAAETAREIPLWPPSKMPGAGAAEPEKEAPTKGDGVIRLTNVSEPNLTIFRAANGINPSPAVIICPGGGYQILAFNKEGTEIATWLNTLGITGIVLKYRVPNNREGALQDLQRAVRLVRANQKQWKYKEICLNYVMQVAFQYYPFDRHRIYLRL